MNTLDGTSEPTRSKHTTYGKAHRPHLPPIGRAPHPGQLAFLEHQQSKTPSRISASRTAPGRSAGATPPAKRRKTVHVDLSDDLVEDLVDDDNDDIMEVSPSALSTPAGTSHERPLSVMSSQSRMSVGSGSTVTGNRPSQATSEFREVDRILRPSRKKSRKSSSNRLQGARPHSPFGSGTMLGSSVESALGEAAIVVNNHKPGRPANARQTILQNLQQGESVRIPLNHRQRSGTSGRTASDHFPNARINESTVVRTASNGPVAGESTTLRNCHKPAPKPADFAADDNMADELAPSPADKQTKQPSKATRAANSGIRRKAPSKPEGIGWPLVFARSYDYEQRDSAFDAKVSKLMLRYGHEGWRVKEADADGNVETKFEIQPQDVTKASADDVRHIRFEGPRRLDGNIHMFDLEFARTPDFLTFRDKYLGPLTKTGTFYSKDE
jgi:sentrin-specific protease 7